MTLHNYIPILEHQVAIQLQRHQFIFPWKLKPKENQILIKHIRLNGHPLQKPEEEA